MTEHHDKPGTALPVSLDQHRMLDTGQMAEAMRYSAEHLRRLVRAGKFPRPVRIGRRFLWPASVLVELGRSSADKGHTVDSREVVEQEEGRG